MEPADIHAASDEFTALVWAVFRMKKSEYAALREPLNRWRHRNDAHWYRQEAQAWLDDFAETA